MRLDDILFFFFVKNQCTYVKYMYWVGLPQQGESYTRILSEVLSLQQLAIFCLNQAQNSAIKDTRVYMNE